jgi:hypothetical protein
MARFINIPPLDIGEKNEEWILTENCIYQSDLWPERIMVPEGTPTDLSSIPRIFRLFIIKNGKHRPAAIVHDHLCRLGLDFSRVTADKVFLEAMTVLKVPRMRRRLMYWAVAINTSRLKLMRKAR